MMPSARIPIAVVVLAMRLMGALVFGEDVNAYRLVQNDTFTLNATECQVYKFIAPAAQFKINIDISEFPEECQLNETLSYTHDAFKQGQCVEYSLERMARCTKRLSKAEDICSNWEKLGRMFNGTKDFDEETSLKESFECISSSYFIGFNSSCAPNATVGIQIFAANLTDGQQNTCVYPDASRKSYFTTLLKILIVLLSICILLCVSIFVFLCCCCCECCPCFNCCRGGEEKEQESSLVEVLVPISPSPIPSTPPSRIASA
ncbi:hypothetical protein BSKO_03803 [Bryopsis sp. KO-2023]|nr:hypothetical protein BSKO_03803 [Bryopsis sp. KO-2023]